MQFGTVDAVGAVVIPADLCFGLAAAGLLVVEIGRRGAGLRGLFPLVAVGYLAAMVVAAIASPAHRESFERIAIDGYCVLLGVMSFVFAREAAARVQIAWAWLAGTVFTVAAALVGIVLFYAGDGDPTGNFAIGDLGSLHTSAVPRVVGFFLNPNMFDSYLIVSLLFGLALVGWRRPVGIALVSAIGVVLVFTLSPGLGGAVLASAIWLAASERHRWTAAARHLVLAVGVLGAVGFLVLTATVGPRAHTWSDALDTIWSHPLLGVGPGLPVSATFYNERFFTDAHNAWLNVAGQAGLVGLLGLVAVVATICVMAWRTRRVCDLPEPVRAGWCAFVGVVLYGSVSLSLEQTRHVWVLLGFLAAGLSASPLRRSGRSTRGSNAARVTISD